MKPGLSRRGHDGKQTFNRQGAISGRTTAALQVRGDSLQQLKGQLLHTGLAGDSQSRGAGEWDPSTTHSPLTYPAK